MSAMYPPYGGPPAQRCLRCGMPLPPNEVTCRNCGTYNPVAQPGSSPQQGQVPWQGASPQMPFGNGQYQGQQWRQTPVPSAQNSEWGQPASPPPQNNAFGTPYTPQPVSSPNDIYGMPGQAQQYYGTPQQNAFYSPPPTMYERYQRGGLNGYSPAGNDQPPKKKGGPKIGLIILVLSLLIVVVVGGAFAGYFFLSNHNQNGNTTTVVPTRIITPTVKPLFGDSFENNKNGWDLSSTAGKFSVTIGGGSMVLEDDDNKLFMEVVPGRSLAGFRLDVDARLSKGDPSNGFGVFIRGALDAAGNLNTYYRFELYGDGTYAIFKGSLDATGNTQSTKVRNYTANPAILKKGQVNHITIIAKGSSMMFMVNGQALYTYVDSAYKSGSVALFVSNLQTLPAGAQATFSHLAIFPAS
jgi:hypothetical protein